MCVGKVIEWEEKVGLALLDPPLVSIHERVGEIIYGEKNISHRFQNELSQINVVAFDGVLEPDVEGFVGVLAPVWDLESDVELRGAKNQKVVAKKLLQFQAIVDCQSQVGGATAHLTWETSSCSSSFSSSCLKLNFNTGSLLGLRTAETTQE